MSSSSECAGDVGGDGGSDGGGESGGVAGGRRKIVKGDLKLGALISRRGNGISEGGDVEDQKAERRSGRGDAVRGGATVSTAHGEQRINSSGQTWHIGPRARRGARRASMSLSFSNSASQHVKHRKWEQDRVIASVSP